MLFMVYFLHLFTHTGAPQMNRKIKIKNLYFEEANVTQHREKSLDDLKEYFSMFMKLAMHRLQ